MSQVMVSRIEQARWTGRMGREAPQGRGNELQRPEWPGRREVRLRSVGGKAIK